MYKKDKILFTQSSKVWPSLYEFSRNSQITQQHDLGSFYAEFYQKYSINMEFKIQWPLLSRPS